jgi:nucleoid-associated protein EbfC
MFDLMGKMKEAQKQMEETKQRLSDIIVEGLVEGGAIKVKANCNLQVTNIEVSDDLLKVENKAVLEDLLIVAINKAIQKAKETQEVEMSKVAQGMLPNLGGLFGK